MTPLRTLVTRWRCVECPATGDTDRGADNHTQKPPHHGTLTRTEPAK